MNSIHKRQEDFDEMYYNVTDDSISNYTESYMDPLAWRCAMKVGACLDDEELPLEQQFSFLMSSGVGQWRMEKIDSVDDVPRVCGLMDAGLQCAQEKVRFFYYYYLDSVSLCEISV